ncbi:hypothetical protein BCV70DRAFT_201298 [Testicularia cyperi]|uniref:UDENN domain-containing protein n=1 Tax=Testicularia cyperi TaxID=1882483 RepID=A0A317XNV3_9BASI|nr:hypothetical protein BCV70DRAFT_201298 [Testicularia cyperi]
MDDNPAEPSGSDRPPNLSLLPANVLTIFLARFHVRHGNQIEYQFPPPPTTSTANGKDRLVDIDEDVGTSDDSALEAPGIDLTDVEWKVLPSGGHLIERDVIYFQPQQSGTIGVACFRNLKLDDSQEADRQRGARMVSVGLILQCPSGSPTETSSSTGPQQLAIVPHLDNLHKLADQLVHSPESTDPLKRYYTLHAFRPDQPEAPLTPRQLKQLRMRRRRDPKNLPHDPITHMPALCGSLGAILPHLLKKMMVSNHRLLVFSPAPPLVHAARIGYNLADFVALAVGRSGRRHDTLQSFAARGLVHVRGQIGVHDITALEDEEKHRRSTGESTNGCGWVAWSTDKILLEKPHLFDSVLDLTPLIGKNSAGLLDEASLESSAKVARLLKVVRTPLQDGSGRVKAELRGEGWTTREFATFNELDAQAERHAQRVERAGDPAYVSRKRVKRRASKGTVRNSYDSSEHDPHLASKSDRRENGISGSRENDIQYVSQPSDAVTQWRGGCARAPRRGRLGTVSAILAFLRYWLAGWWFLPRHWRYGLPAAYVLPLGIRGDGGVRASILVLPEDESDEDSEDEENFEEAEEEGEDEERIEDQNAMALQEAGQPMLSPEEAFSATAHSEHNVGTDDNTTTTSSSETVDGAMRASQHNFSHHLVPPDPLIAACGASPVRGSVGAESDRMSYSSRRRPSIDPSSYARSNGGADLDDLTSEDGRAFRRYRTILSDSLWMVWSHWTTALIFGLLDILEDRLTQVADVAEADAHSDADSAELIPPDLSSVELVLKPADMASLGLSAGNPVDVELVEVLGSQYLNLLVSEHAQGAAAVRVDKGWAILRWLL